ncbi:tubulin/FtsZ family protein [Oesophagostomum dentatum]|uniref:Tubulin/FtsZ family protein n=1 Tax=Oesophagostomum dentatum TaxID=61180 RepID=A0A0B1SGR6_OESDE|nr:tubulin/FtsZ family protein [Oesophagostomum dentatum]
MSSSTATFRFDSHILTSIRSLFISPLQPLHFIQAGFSPVVDPNESFTRKTSVVDVVRNLLKPSSMMVSTASMTKPTHCMLSAYLFLQGQITSTDVNTVCLSENHSINAIRRAPWDLTNPLRILHTPSSPYIKPQYKVSGLMLNNNTSIAPLFERILQQFARLRSKNAFIDRFQKEACYRLYLTTIVASFSLNLCFQEGFTVDMMDSSAERVQDLINLYGEAEKPDFLG